MPEKLDPKHDEVLQRLRVIRAALLTLHKSLVDAERGTYEKTFGKIKSPGHFLQLVTRDPWFAWLHPISQLIVTMDEALDEKEPLTPAVVDTLIKETAALLVASEAGEGFSRHYFDALQNDPGVVIAHGELAKLTGARKRRA
jgi:hypothetical protein